MNNSPDFLTQLTHWLPAWQTLLPILTLLILGGGFALFLQRLLGRHFNKMASHASISPSTVFALRRTLNLAIWLIFFLLLMRQAGINVDGIWALLASTLAIIGVGLLAVWTMVSNITASLFIWIWRPYELGETIEILPANIKGRAVDRSLMFTTIREADGSLLMVPNNQFFQNTTRRWPNRTQLTDFEAWEAEQTRGANGQHTAAVAVQQPRDLQPDTTGEGNPPV
ncbi:MAG TPA: mechanosensitive ion channel [Halothiobacillus sp.]|nr:MAG: hypothetical protein B7Z82_03725 [Halothiobacillus sp. 20-54-6]HQT42844.1 mechanosensitive ion channel [Halothiobacillus sp.]